MLEGTEYIIVVIQVTYYIAMYSYTVASGKVHIQYIIND